MQQTTLIQLFIMSVLIGCIAAAIAVLPQDIPASELAEQAKPACAEYLYGSTRKSVQTKFAECMAAKVDTSPAGIGGYRIKKTRHYEHKEVWDLSMTLESRNCYDKEAHWYFDTKSLEFVDKEFVVILC